MSVDEKSTLMLVMRIGFCINDRAVRTVDGNGLG